MTSPCSHVTLGILEEHFEQLDFLWEQRERIVFAPDWVLAELAEWEERAEAHLDGLRIGASNSVELARPFLAGAEPGAATAAALVLMSMGQQDLELEVVRSLTESTPEARDGIRVALRHSDIRRVSDRLRETAAQGDIPARAAAVDVLAFHRQPLPTRWVDLLDAPDPAARRLAIAACGRARGPWTAERLTRALADADGGVRRAALETSARVALPGMAAICRQAARPPHAASAEALVWLGVLGDVQDVPLLVSALRETEVAAAALQGLGASGRIEAVPELLALMPDPNLAVAAGAAFVRIAGTAGIAAERVVPAPVEAPEDDVDTDVASDRPDPERARAFWQREGQRFVPAGRWQSGLDVQHGPLAGPFDALPLASRRDVYLAARWQDPASTPDLELEARARLQRPGL